jgi:HK97 family phage prohead protease
MTSLIVPAAEPVLRHAITVKLDQVAWRDSGDPARPNETTLRGHAAVFNSLSEDLGGFRELLEPGAFRAALRGQPDVRLLFNHDPNFVMARTASGTLELREDDTGLHVFARVDKSMTWVSDLRTAMQRGDIDQMSFAFTLAQREDADTWVVTDDGQIVRTIRTDGIDGLYDVSVVTYPAYTSTQADMREVLMRAVSLGRLPGGAVSTVEPDSAGVGTESRTTGAGEESESRKRLVALKARAAQARTIHASTED